MGIIRGDNDAHIEATGDFCSNNPKYDMYRDSLQSC